MRKKTTIVTHKNLSNFEVFILPFLDGVAHELPADIVYVEDFIDSNELADFLDNEINKQVNIFFVRFKWLIEAFGLHRPSKKYRIIYEQDAAQNYLTVASSIYIGAWTKYLRLLNSDLVVVTDKETRDRLNNDGILAYWLPKAVDETRFSIDQWQRREFVLGFYGSLYGARAHALAVMKKNGIKINHFSVDYEHLSKVISQHQAILICNAAAKYFFPRLKRWQIKMPLHFIKPTQAWQVMAKNYEVCASNSLMLADHVGEMDELGFKSGKNCLLYKSTDEMVDMAHWISAHPEKVEIVAGCGRQFVLEKHTWAHRVKELVDLVNKKYLI